MSFLFRLAPADNNSFTTSECPPAEAFISAVSPENYDGKRTTQNPLIQCYCISHMYVHLHIITYTVDTQYNYMYNTCKCKYLL